MNQNVLQEPILINGIEMYIPMEEDHLSTSLSIQSTIFQSTDNNQEIISQTPLNTSKITQSSTPDEYTYIQNVKDKHQINETYQ